MSFEGEQQNFKYYMYVEFRVQVEKQKGKKRSNKAGQAKKVKAILRTKHINKIKNFVLKLYDIDMKLKAY